MATEKQVMMRINATKNISKITQSMKMVSAAKLRGDQARLEKAQPFNVSPVQLEFTSSRLQDHAAGLLPYGSCNTDVTGLDVCTQIWVGCTFTPLRFKGDVADMCARST